MCLENLCNPQRSTAQDAKNRMSEVYMFQLIKLKTALMDYGRPEKLRFKVAELVSRKRKDEMDRAVATALAASQANASAPGVMGRLFGV